MQRLFAYVTAPVSVLLLGLVGMPVLSHAETRSAVIVGAGGVPLYVIETGQPSDPGILFIHGNGQTADSWSRQFESELADTHHLVAFDLRGHGRSGKPWSADAYDTDCVWADDIEAVMEYAGMSKPVVVAWSFGGLVAAHYLNCKGQDAWAGLVLVGSRARLVPSPVGTGADDARSSQADLQSDSLSIRMRGARTFARQMTYQSVDGNEFEHMTVSNLLAPPYVRKLIRGPVRDRAGRQIPDYTGLAKTLDLPMQIVLGRFDAIHDAPQLAASFANAFPSATVLLYDRSGHSPFQEEPDRFNSDLAAFVAKGRNDTLREKD